MRSSPFLLAAVAGGALLLAASGCHRSTAAQSAARDNAATAAVAVRVTARHPVRRTMTLSTTQPGQITAFEQTPLFPKVSGYVERVVVDIGDRVTKDQVLIELWVPELQDEREQNEALVAQAAAEVRQAEAAVQEAEAAVTTSEARVSQAKAGVSRAQAEFDRWESEHQRIRELAGRGSVTQKLVDETFNQFRAAEAARDEALAGVQSAEAGLIEARTRVAKAQADLAAAQARHRVAQADLKRAVTMLAYREIRAPFDGVVTRRHVDTGHYVHPASGGNSEPLLAVARTDKVRAVIDVPEGVTPLVDAGADGDAVVVRIQALHNREFSATVTRTSWSLDPSNRSLRTEINIPNEDGSLRPGMYATVTIDLEQRENALALPTTAIVRDGPQAYCCCVASGRIERRPIELGLRFGDEVEVLSGLSESDVVVLARADSLKPGQPVEVIEPEG